MALALDLALKFRLQQHLVNSHHPQDALPLELGTFVQLTLSCKIKNHHRISNCFQAGIPTIFPSLPKNQYVVARVDQWVNTKIIAVYNLDQIQKIDAVKYSGSVKSLRWRILEIPEILKPELLKNVFIDKGVIIPDRGPLWRIKN